ncbi:class I SAM-dependent methyltransferase [bacterium]|nr:class I SAM-dependent methyltransferase [bacterium]
MKADQVKWDSKYNNQELIDQQEDPFFSDSLAYFSGSSVLDLAGGCGENSIYLASKDYRVSLIDISPKALVLLENQCLIYNVQVKGIQMDLDELELFQKLPCFDNIIISYFKPSYDLWKILHTKLNQNGRIFLHTYNVQQHFKKGFPLKFCLMPDEYRTLSDQLTLIQHKDYSTNNNYIDSYIFEKIV